MFSIFRRRGRATKPEENQATVAQTDSDTKVEFKYQQQLTVSKSREQVALKPGARVSDPTLKLDSTQPSKEKQPPTDFVNYHHHGDGVVASNPNANSRTESADPLRRLSGNHDPGDEKSEVPDDKPSKRSSKSKSLSLNRRSVFLRPFQSAPSGSNYSAVVKSSSSKELVKHPVESPPPPPPFVKSPAPVSVPETTNRSSKRFNPLTRGREIFNDYLMAKGRHRNQRNIRRKKANTIASEDDIRIVPVERRQQNDPAFGPSSSNIIHETSTDDHDTHEISSTSKYKCNKKTKDVAPPPSLSKVLRACSVHMKSKKRAKADKPDKLKINDTLLYPCYTARIFTVSTDSTTSESSSDDQAGSEYQSPIATEETVAIASNTTETEACFEKAHEQAEKEPKIKLVTDETGIFLEGDNERTAAANVEQSGQSRVDTNFSDLTECDQDHFRVSCNEDMGQSQAKIEPSTSAAAVFASAPRSPSPKLKEFRESHLADDNRQHQESSPLPTDTNAQQRVVPKIIVEDFGETGSDDKNDVFYDVEVPKNEHNFLKVPEEVEDDDDDDEDDEPWHFVSTLQQNVNHTASDYVNAGTTVNYPKVENLSDSNLSNSDSGVVTTDPHAKVLHLDSCDLVNESGKEPAAQSYRDGSATDCDENLPRCDEFHYYRDLPTVVDNLEVVVEDHDNQAGILIESISLPDVVVETTVVKNASSDSVNSEHHVAVNNDSDNIDNSGCVKMGNAHFIPIRVEKRRSVDDSVLMSKSASGGNVLYNGQQYNEERSTLEITPEEDEHPEVDQVEAEKVVTSEQVTDVGDAAKKEQMEQSTSQEERLKKDLVDQESCYSTQLSDAQKNIYNLEAKVNELQAKIDELEKDLSAKSWNVERLQGELGAAAREDECVRSRLRLLEEEKSKLRQQYFEIEEGLKNKYDDLEQQYKELEEKYKQIQALAANLQTQLAYAQSEAEQCRLLTESLRQEKDDQIGELEQSLATAKQEQVALHMKWHSEFEILRTQNADREEHLMTDCEWQLRQMQRTCKDKLERAENERKEAVEKTEQIEKQAEDTLREVAHLRSYEAEVKQLRGLTADQENSIQSMREQIDTLKADLVTANENLEEQIENVRKIKFQCDNALYDKEREMLQRIDEVRHEAAVRWENKLITEMTRLKMELESVYVDERREELDKLQAEHIEELKALTSRYTANEEELRAEIAELQESLHQRTQEFMDLREKSDNAILTTRMHLDRADREYQTAMCREEERREHLIENLRKEFEEEKLDMEEKFRERLGQVKDEFNKELQISTQDLTEKHRKDMEQQWQKLISEKETAVQELESRHRKRLEEAEKRLHDAELRHQHDLADFKIMYDTEKVALDKRDISNAQEIEQLHRKCRCLTNLFEEMRMRYERREPRPEDLREIAELRSRCESQERDLFELTDRLREMQIQMEELQGTNKQKSQIRKPPPKSIPTNCDVIYEENEEQDSQPLPPSSPSITAVNGDFDKNSYENIDQPEKDEEDDIEEEDDDDDDDEDSEHVTRIDNTINDDDTSLIDSEKTKSLNMLNESIIDNNNKTINNFNHIIGAE